MSKKTTLNKYLPFILIAGGATALYFYFKPKTSIQPELMPGSTPSLPPSTGTTPTTTTTTPTAPTIKPLMIGQAAKVKTGVTANGYITRFKGTIYPSGGNKAGLGGLKADT